MAKLTEQDLHRLAEWGYGCYQQGDLKRARVFFAAILELRPTDAYAARGLAGVALQQGHAEEAIALMTRVLSAHPANLECRLRLVEALIAASKAEDARSGIVSLRGRVPEPQLLRLELRLRGTASA